MEKASRGKLGLVMVRFGSLRQARRGMVRYVRCGVVSLVGVRQARCGLVVFGMLSCGWARQGRRGEVGSVTVW